MQQSGNEAKYFETPVWVISLGKKIKGKIAYLCYLPQNIHYMPGNRRYPFILTFTRKEKAEAYLEYTDLSLGGHRIEKHILKDVLVNAMQKPCNIAIDKTDEDTPHPWVNVIKMIADLR